jgi:hypothetical protein
MQKIFGNRTEAALAPAEKVVTFPTPRKRA